MRNSLIGIFLFLVTSCTTRGIIPDAIKNGEKINIRVEHLGGAFTPFYDVLVQKNGEEYELTHKEATTSTTYKLPANKLELLLEMEVSLKDLNHLSAKYFRLTITSGKKKKSYNINTDVVHDLITGLKKK